MHKYLTLHKIILYVKVYILYNKISSDEGWRICIYRKKYGTWAPSI